MFALIILNIFILFAISGYLFFAMTWLFSHLYDNPFGAAVLAGLFLLAVTFGIHQGFVPIYAALVAETGVNGLFPVLAMAGAGQVGTCIML